MVPTVSSGPRTVQSIDRAMAIIELLAEEPGGLSLSELSQRLGLQMQTLHSLLRTLQQHGWVAQEGPRRPYRLGPAPARLHRRWMEGRDRASLAAPMVVELSNRIGEYVILAEWSGSQLVPLAEVHADHELKVRGEAFSADRLHVMATGKVLLAGMSEKRMLETIATLPLGPWGPNAVVDRKVLLEQMEVIRRQGYAICREEAARGVVALAVPVGGSWGAGQGERRRGEDVAEGAEASEGAAALGISLPLARCSAKRVEELLGELLKTARGIEKVWSGGVL